MTREQAQLVEAMTNWNYHVRTDGADEKFVIQKQGTRGADYRELVLLLLQNGPTLVYWTDTDRDRLQAQIVPMFNEGLPRGTCLAPAIPHGQNNNGHVFNLRIVNISSNEIYSQIDQIREVVDEMCRRLRNHRFLN